MIDFAPRRLLVAQHLNVAPNSVVLVDIQQLNAYEVGIGLAQDGEAPIQVSE